MLNNVLSGNGRAPFRIVHGVAVRTTEGGSVSQCHPQGIRKRYWERSEHVAEVWKRRNAVSGCYEGDATFSKMDSIGFDLSVLKIRQKLKISNGLSIHFSKREQLKIIRWKLRQFPNIWVIPMKSRKYVKLIRQKYFK